MNAKTFRYDALLAMMGEGVLLHAPDGTILGCNAAAERILGTSANELVGAPVAGDLLTREGAPLPHDDRPSVRAARTGQPVSAQLGMIVPGRPVQWVSVRASLLPDGIVATTFVDITEQRVAEDALRETEARFAALVEGSPDLICILDAQYGVEYASPSLRRHLGWRPGDALGRSAADKVHPDDWERVRAAWTGATPEHPAIELGPYRVMASDRSWRWIEAQGTARFDAGRFAGGDLIGRDVSERVEAEAREHRWAQMLERLVAAYTDGIVVVDRDGRIAMVNDTYCEMFGLPAPFALIGTDYLATVGSTASRFADPADWRRRVAADRAAGELVSGRTVELANGGRMIWEFLPLGELQLWSYYEVTEMKRLEERLRRARDEALEAVRDKEEFLATMSHEVRTPLAGIAGAAELLRDDRLTPEQDDLVAVIADAAGALGGLLGDVLDVSRVESGRGASEVRDFDPRALLEAIGGVLRPTLHDRPVALEVRPGEGLPAVLRGDADRIRQIVLNLAGNAVKYTERGHVRLAAAYRGGELSVTVSDTGNGIAPGELERLFAPWTRGHGSEVAGTGLGLSIVRRLARALGGEVRATSALGTGSQFTLTVPCAVGGSDAAGGALAAPAAPLAGRVLLAEDDHLLQRVLARQLERLGVTVTVAGDGGAALAAATAGEHDLLLADLRMPVLDGIAVAAGVREHERRTGRARLPILALSADARPADVDASLAAGMDGHLAKPVAAHALRAALAAWLPEQPQPQLPVLDPDVLDELTGGLGDAAPLLDVLRTYRAELPGRLDRLRAVAAAGEREDVRRAAHALRSPSVSFGLMRLGAELRPLEDGTVPAVDGFDAVRAAAAEADAALAAWCAARAA